MQFHTRRKRIKRLPIANSYYDGALRDEKPLELANVLDDGSILRPVQQKFFKNLGATSKLYAPGGRYEESSVLSNDEN
jgi:hypothetical protein